MKLTSKKLRAEAIKIIKKERSNPSYIYTEEEIKRSKYPDKVCALCGQKGSEIKYAERYLHKKCYKKLKKLSNSLMK